MKTDQEIRREHVEARQYFLKKVRIGDPSMVAVASFHVCGDGWDFSADRQNGLMLVYNTKTLKQRKFKTEETFLKWLASSAGRLAYRV